MQNRHLFISVIIISLITLTSCIIDIPKVILVDSDPFNNIDNRGVAQLDYESELIVLIPDIQLYTHYKEYNIILESMIDRIIEINQIGYKVKAVVQVGDITEKNDPKEWEVAKTIFYKLYDESINYILTTGNHDYGDDGTTNSRQTYFNDYFNFSNQQSFIECYQDQYYENSLFEIEIHGNPFQIITLEFGPPNAVVQWANNVLDKNKKSLLITHAYLNRHQERYNWKEWGTSQTISPYSYGHLHKNFGGTPLNVNDGEDIWKKLVYPSSNLQFVLCGHKTKPDYVGNLISKNVEEKDVLQMLFNTQALPNGGDGWMQILEFKKDKKTVITRTYSSLFNSWDTNDLFQFEFLY